MRRGLLRHDQVPLPHSGRFTWFMADRSSRKLNYSAPVLAFDYPADADPIWPCTECLPWHVEVIQTPEEGVLVREWHAADCSTFDDHEDGPSL